MDDTVMFQVLGSPLHPDTNSHPDELMKIADVIWICLINYHYWLGTIIPL
jgi:hypothetical protein